MSASPVAMDQAADRRLVEWTWLELSVVGSACFVKRNEAALQL
jgi:hypothetical protein